MLQSQKASSKGTSRHHASIHPIHERAPAAFGSEQLRNCCETKLASNHEWRVSKLGADIKKLLLDVIWPCIRELAEQHTDTVIVTSERSAVKRKKPLLVKDIEESSVSKNC